MPLQRNATDHPLDVPAASVTVQPGDTVDWPVPVMGFEPVEDEPEPDADGSGDQEQNDGPEPSPPKSTRKRAATRPAGEESTS